jgi:hypothetical protein
VGALPQWLPPPAAAEEAWRGSLARRRLKLEVAVLRARGLVSARGDSGEPQVCLECAGAQLASTQPARGGGADPSWLETFTLCVPASALLLPSGAVQPDGGALHVVVRDTRTSSKVTSPLPWPAPTSPCPHR